MIKQGGYNLEDRTIKFSEEIIAKANPNKINECRILWKEAQELTLIFSKISLTLKENN